MGKLAFGLKFAVGLVICVSSLWVFRDSASAQNNTPNPIFPIGATVIVTSNRGLNVRVEPGTEYNVVASLAQGTKVIVLEGPIKNNGVDWYKVKLSSDQSGWASALFLSLTTSISIESSTLTATPKKTTSTSILTSPNPPATIQSGPLDVCMIVIALDDISLQEEVFTQTELKSTVTKNSELTILELPQLANGTLWVKVQSDLSAGWTKADFLNSTERYDDSCRASINDKTDNGFSLSTFDLPSDPIVLIVPICGGFIGLFVIYRLTRVQNLATKLISFMTLALTLGIALYGAVAIFLGWTSPVQLSNSLLSWLIIVYSLNSIITFMVFSYDKRAATSDEWRIPETNLHCMEFLGGWPGALVAQQIFRHKRRKPDFMALSVLIVISHLVFWGWYVWSIS